MKTKTGKSKTGRRKEQSTKAINGKWDFHLFIAGQTQKSVTALSNLKIFCNEQLTGKYNIKVIDILVHPQLARTHQILAVPTLIRKSPLPVKNIIGDLSNTEQVMFGLNLLRSSEADSSIFL